jgi:hypothetical protein
MSDRPDTNSQKMEQAWAKPVDALRVGSIPGSAVNLNVEGRHITGPVRGFGQLWQKTYRIVFQGRYVTPVELVSAWKANFPSFWPQGNRFYGVQGSITPGDVAVLNLGGPNGLTAPGGAPIVSTGIMVIYADDVSFSFITPEGHMFAGMITFSGMEEGSQTVAQIQALIRASDPFFETMFRLGFSHRMEDVFWFQTLRNLAAYFGATGEPTLQRILVDPKVQWSEARNLRFNSAMSTFFYLLGSRFRWMKSKINPAEPE